jgi:hypothetical protein
MNNTGDFSGNATHCKQQSYCLIFFLKRLWGTWLFCIVIAMSAIVNLANAQSTEIPEPPEIPPQVQSGEEMQPDITIIRKGEETIQEYRRNGKLYMVKITPKIGSPYYMLDTNGDGEMDVKKNDIDKNSRINLWNLLEWDWP